MNASKRHSTGRSRKVNSRFRFLLFIAVVPEVLFTFYLLFTFYNSCNVQRFTVTFCCLLFIFVTLGFSGAPASWIEMCCLLFMLLTFRERPVSRYRVTSPSLPVVTLISLRHACRYPSLPLYRYVVTPRRYSPIWLSLHIPSLPVVTL